MAKDKNIGLYFDGSTEVGIGSAEGLKLKNRSFTVELWVKIDRYDLSNANRDSAILGSTSRNGAHSSLLHLTLRNKRPYLGFFHNDTAGRTVIEEKKWYHLAYVYNKKNLQQLIYVNGKLDVDSKQLFGSPFFPTPNADKVPFIGDGPIALGNCRSGRSFLQGNIKGLRIWDSVLSPARIADYMNRVGLAGESGLTAYWTFKDGFVNNSTKELTQTSNTSEVDDLNDKLDIIGNENRVLKIDLETIKKEKENLSQTLKEREAELIDLKEKAKRVASGDTKVSIANLIEDANKQIAEARKQLVQSDYNLGHVNLQFKMIPSELGDGVIFPSKEEIANSAGSLSTIDIEFAPKDATKVVETPKYEIPDVTGLTEIMARRKIAQAGFLTEMKFKAVEDRKDKDRVVKQIPSPENTPLVEANTTILIFIGKEIM